MFANCIISTPRPSSHRRGWAACCATGAYTMCVCLAWVLTPKSSVLTDPEPKQYGAHLGSIQVKICFFTLGGWRERRTQRPCFARSEVCSDAGLMNFIYWWSAMGPIEFPFANCKCGPTIFRGFAIVPIRANSPAFIAPPISSFIPVFRKHLALQHWNARPAARP